MKKEDNGWGILAGLIILSMLFFIFGFYCGIIFEKQNNINFSEKVDICKKLEMDFEVYQDDDGNIIKIICIDKEEQR